jgi:hypothetical protein
MQVVHATGVVARTWVTADIVHVVAGAGNIEPDGGVLYIGSSATGLPGRDEPAGHTNPAYEMGLLAGWMFWLMWKVLPGS